MSDSTIPLEFLDRLDRVEKVTKDLAALTGEWGRLVQGLDDEWWELRKVLPDDDVTLTIGQAVGAVSMRGVFVSWIFTPVFNGDPDELEAAIARALR